jgi:type 1 glutamine amidotransferase
MPVSRLALSVLAGAALLGAQEQAAFKPDAAERIPVLIVSGANNHDCEWTTPELRKIFEETGRFVADVTTEPGQGLADREALRKYRAIVLDYNGPRWGEAAESAFLDAVRTGTGVTVIHAANNPFPGWVDYEKLVGHLWREGTGHGRFHPFDVKVIDRDHPITADMQDLLLHPDELYHALVNVHGAEHRILATAFSSKESGGSGKDEPMLMVGSFGEGRVFHTPLGHVWREVPATRASWADPQFRALVARGTEWAATGSVTIRPAFVTRLSLEEKAAGFRLLFDGETTTGLRAYRSETFPNEGWLVEDGALRCLPNGGGGDVATAEQFGDFELRFQWKVAPGANSGVIYRVTEDEPHSYQTGPEYQVLDDTAHKNLDPRTSAGALYGLFAPRADKVLRKPGAYNDAAIVVRGRHVEHWLNGQKVVNWEMAGEEWERELAASKFKSWPKFAGNERGHIVFQDHGNAVWYRLIRVREL